MQEKVTDALKELHKRERDHMAELGRQRSVRGLQFFCDCNM